MQSLTVFEFPGNHQEMGVYVDGNDRPWFRATNVCSVLGFSNPSEALKSHCSNSYKEYAIGRGRPSNYVSESGLYRLMLASKAPMAEQFRDWVCDDVLPAIRKNGSFGNVPNNQSEASEFWQLIDGAIARNMDIDKVIDAKLRFEGKMAQPILPRNPAHPKPIEQRSKLDAMRKFCSWASLQEGSNQDTLELRDLWKAWQTWQSESKLHPDDRINLAQKLFPALKEVFPDIKRSKNAKTRRAVIAGIKVLDR